MVNTAMNGTRDDEMQQQPEIKDHGPVEDHLTTSITKDYEEPSREADPFGDETGEATVKYKTVEWWETSFLMVAETVSLGILSLPKVISTMGFIPGVLLIIIIGVISTYTGWLVGQFKLAHPSIHSFADAAEILGGPIARHVVSLAQQLVLVFIAAAHVLTFSIAMNVLTAHGTCTVTFAAVGTLVSLVLTLPRTLKNVSWLSALCEWDLRGPLTLDSVELTYPSVPINSSRRHHRHGRDWCYQARSGLC